MSQALNALMNIGNDDVVTYASEPETEGCIVIRDDRHITVPEKLKRIAVQYDHNVETVTFDCPRYWDDHDMSKMIVYINYRLPNGDPGSYVAANIKASGNRMSFDWTILKDVTPHKGNLIFLVCIKKTNAEGVEENHWNSELCTDMYISEGLETVEQVTYDYPDLVNQLLERMTVVEQINVQADEMQTLRDATVAAAEEADAAKTEAITVKESVDASLAHVHNDYANAIRNTESGSFVRVDDVSPIEHTVKTKVRSKNLIPLPYDEVGGEKSGATFTVLEDGGIRVIGTPTSNTSFNLTMQYKKRLLVEKGKTYTVSVTSTLSDARGYVFVQNWANGEAVDNESLRRGSLTFVPSENGSMQIGIVLLKDQVYDEVMYIWLEEGDASTAYTPYVDPSTVFVNACGKNIFKLAGKTQTLNGITCTVNTDGSVTVNGTAEKATFFGLGGLTPVIGEKHRLSGCPSGGDFDTYILYIHNNTTGGDTYDLGSGKVFTGVAGDQGLTIAVYAGTTVNNLKFYPMVTIGEEVEEFEPYVGATYIPASDGTVEGVTSAAPTMCVYPDLTNVVVDVTYNCDTSTHIENIKSLIMSGGVPINTTLTDTVTGDFYSLSVANGKLTLTKLEV